MIHDPEEKAGKVKSSGFGENGGILWIHLDLCSLKSDQEYIKREIGRKRGGKVVGGSNLVSFKGKQSSRVNLLVEIDCHYLAGAGMYFL